MRKIFTFLKKLSGNTETGIIFLSLFVYQLVFIFFGFDIADQGWQATFFQQIFYEPKSVQYCFGMWLTGIIGGAWLCLFPESGIIGIKILGIITFTLTLIFVYFLLRNYFNRKYLMYGLLITTLITGPYWAYFGFNYHTLSALFFVMMIFFLFQGLKKQDSFKIILSGFFLGLSALARIPSISGILILLPVIYYGHSNKLPVTVQFKTIFSFISGLSLAFFAAIFLMKLLNHNRIYWDYLLFLINLGKGEGNSHGVFNLISVYFLQYSDLLKIAVKLFIFLLIYIYAFSKIKSKILLILPLLIGYLIYLSLIQKNFVRTNEFFIYYSLIISSSVFIFFFDDKINFDQKFLVLLGLTMFLLLPLGSNFGLIGKNGLVLFIALPITIERFLCLRSSTILLLFKIKINLSEELLSAIKKSSIILLVFCSQFSAYYYSYCENNWKHSLRYPIENKLAKGAFASKERAAALNELLAESPKYVKKGDYVLAYDYIQMFYFLTETKPYLYNCYLDIENSKNGSFNFLMKNSFDEKKILPVIVKQKTNFWGNNFDNDTIGQGERNTVFKKTLGDFKYNVVWENNAFQILLPN